MNCILSLECLWSERENGAECSESEMKSLLAPPNLHLEIKRAFRELLYLLRRGWSYITAPDPAYKPTSSSPPEESSGKVWSQHRGEIPPRSSFIRVVTFISSVLFHVQFSHRVRRALSCPRGQVAGEEDSGHALGNSVVGLSCLITSV